MELDSDQIALIERLQNDAGFRLLCEFAHSYTEAPYWRHLNKAIVDDMDKCNHNTARGTIAGIQAVLTIPETIRESWETIEHDRELARLEEESLSQMNEGEENGQG
jgi:hypothetical protein